MNSREAAPQRKFANEPFALALAGVLGGSLWVLLLIWNSQLDIPAELPKLYLAIGLMFSLMGLIHTIIGLGISRIRRLRNIGERYEFLAVSTGPSWVVIAALAGWLAMNYLFFPD